MGFAARAPSHALLQDGQHEEKMSAYFRKWRAPVFAALLIGVLAATTLMMGKAFAATPINGSLDFVGMPTTDSLAAEGWAWDANTSTLTLNGLDLSCDSGDAVSLPPDSTIVLMGSNNIANTDHSGYGIHGDGLTVEGSGSLTISSDGDGININGDLTIQSSTLNITVSDGSGIVVGGAVTINASDFGIMTNGALNISGGNGTIQATLWAAVSADAITLDPGVTVKGGAANETAIIGSIPSQSTTTFTDANGNPFQNIVLSFSPILPTPAPEPTPQPLPIPPSDPAFSDGDTLAAGSSWTAPSGNSSFCLGGNPGSAPVRLRIDNVPYTIVPLAENTCFEIFSAGSGRALILDSGSAEISTIVPGAPLLEARNGDLVSSDSHTGSTNASIRATVDPVCTSTRVTVLEGNVSAPEWIISPMPSTGCPEDALTPGQKSFMNSGAPLERRLF